MTTRELNIELWQAIGKADPDQVKKLIAKGADINALGDRKGPLDLVNKTPLWASVSLAANARSLSDIAPERSDLRKKRRRYLSIIRLLIRGGAETEKRCYGSTPLRVACVHNDIEVAGVLLANGADPNAEIYSPLSRHAKRLGRRELSGYYGTILHEIVSKGYQWATAALISAGADPNRVDHEGRTAFDIANSMGGGPISELLGRTERQRHRKSK